MSDVIDALNVFNRCITEPSRRKRQEFFKPYESKSVFALEVGRTIFDSALLLIIDQSDFALLTLAAVLGAAAFGAKGLAELATSNPQKADESFETSAAILKVYLSLSICLILDPIVDLISLVTRSAATVAHTGNKNESGNIEEREFCLR